MYQLASDDVPHYNVTITVVIPIQSDRRGRSRHKTYRLIDSVQRLVEHKVISLLWGYPAYFGKLVIATSSRADCGSDCHLEIKVPAPLSFDFSGLVREVEKILNDIGGEQLISYIRSIRHYTLDELLEHCR